MQKRRIFILFYLSITFYCYCQVPQTGNPLEDTWAWGIDDMEEIIPRNRSAYIIQRHTGLSLSAHSYYGGIRFYNQESPHPYGYNGLMVMSVTDGRVGIRTISPVYELDVNGVIRAKEIKVETGWADFVFDKDYNLPLLSEVEEYIQKNGHLKGIPTEKDVKENGVNLGEMNAKLLQKVEELTLYIIHMNKEINTLKEENTCLRKEIKNSNKD